MGANIIAGRRVFYTKAAYYLPYTAVFLRILRGVAPIRGGSDQAKSNKYLQGEEGKIKLCSLRI